MNSEFTIAVHCLLFLGIREGRIANSEDIAESVSTHPARVRKVLSVLRKHQYVMTKEGAHGGYMLNSKPDEVRLGDLYRLFALGSFGPHWRSGDEDSSCMVSSNIKDVMGTIYHDGEHVVEQYLDSITLAEVKHRLEDRWKNRDLT
ncbi:Rrf2 family transcriptional regulator [Paenibacillus urinalis]|uniref:Rrf2 family transcriptional regulator n=1 Tax=Paenibacillus urinalis TaxID=521520 RepID=A0AAX3N338_9BACL|nr:MULTISPECIES: Rrf2 family transcriptional regulator [Paenibacillus]WDH83032.1 Rrf2 family transcriptional regulator [Paenibacillus urinalis]WDH99087.1 Rrf2 family transcriptional regulator [Paenibacillus urinalis]WDI02777.1 Rrf2 family transcriptional regulator [Paenibacillus urinalis]GAK40270.1 transcriptional regulator [Paenibacillus sp. TCA20]